MKVEQPGSPSSSHDYTNLCARNVQVILAYQHPTGAYPASPVFAPYRYAWFRDGAFIAYAMDLVGHHESARRFHGWAVDVILRHKKKALRAIDKARRGVSLGEDFLHARYTLTGEEVGDDWPNFQLDGLGTWLWALQEHVTRTNFVLPSRWEEAVTITCEYLAALWQTPCYDLWEEDKEHLHTYTLSAIAAGLLAATPLSPGTWTDTAHQIRSYLLQVASQTGHFTKYAALAQTPSGSAPNVDASLVGVAVPYALTEPDTPLMKQTVSLIERLLHRPGGGVYRYVGDRYYGGGEWTLLAAWLGWYYALSGEWERARELEAWVATQVDDSGFLPEQVTTHAQHPASIAVWERRWGPVARPLLWAHAMHLILCHTLRST